MENVGRSNCDDSGGMNGHSSSSLDFFKKIMEIKIENFLLLPHTY